MVINPIVGVYIPIIRIPIKGGMTIPTDVFSPDFWHSWLPRNRRNREAAELRLDDFWAQHLATGFYSMAIYRQAARSRGQRIFKERLDSSSKLKAWWLITWLGGDFKYFLFSPLPGEDSHFDYFFPNGLKPPTRWCFFEALLLQIPLQLLVLCSWAVPSASNSFNHKDGVMLREEDSVSWNPKGSADFSQVAPPKKCFSPVFFCENHI